MAMMKRFLVFFKKKGLIKPERIVKEINDAMPENAYIVVDPGTPCPYFSAYYNFKKSGRYFITNRAHGALGYALPASIGVQIGKPKNKTDVTDVIRTAYKSDTFLRHLHHAP